MSIRNSLATRLLAMIAVLVLIVGYTAISWATTRREIRQTLVNRAREQSNSQFRALQHWVSALHSLGNLLVLDNNLQTAQVDTRIVLFQAAYPNTILPIFVIQAQNGRLLGASPISDSLQHPYLRLARNLCGRSDDNRDFSLGNPTRLPQAIAPSSQWALPTCIAVRDASGQAMLNIMALLPWPLSNRLTDDHNPIAGVSPQLTLTSLGPSYVSGQQIHVMLGDTDRSTESLLPLALRDTIEHGHTPNGYTQVHGSMIAWARVFDSSLVVTASLPINTIWLDWLLHGGAGEGVVLLLLFATALGISARRSAALAGTESQLRRYYGALKDINQTLVTTPEPHKLYSTVCAQLVDGAELPLAWIGTLQGMQVKVHAVSGPARGYVDGIELVIANDNPAGRGPVGLALRDRETVTIPDLQRHSGFAFWRAQAARYGLRSVVVTPFTTIRGEQGVLAAYAKQADFFKPALIQLMEELARDVSLGLNQYDRVQEITRLSQQDSLTGLPNRAYFMRALEQALARADRAERLTAIGILDLDYFKQINDTLGHLVGDQMLKHLGLQLSQAVRQGDTVARLGGDEFGILLEGVAGTAELEIVAERLLTAVRQPIHIEGLGHQLQSDGSLGFTLYPLDEGSPDDLMRHADAALYAVKGAGRHRWQLFSREMASLAKREYLIHRRLPAALAAQELQLHFQPQIDLAKGTVIGAEALVRWAHPSTGLWLPGSFIPTIEADTGLARQLGRFLLNTAAMSITRWRADERAFGRLSINICARHLQHSAFLGDLDEVLERYPEAATGLTLELTETYALADLDKSARVLAEVRARGLRVALDDFGSGYASLQYVRELPLDTIKLDLQFVQNLERDTEAFAVGYAALTLAEIHGATVSPRA